MTAGLDVYLLRGPCSSASLVLPLSGLCHSGHTAHDLSCGHSLLVRLTHYPQHLPNALGGVAHLLRPLAPRHGGLPLLQGHYHLPGTPTKGITALSLQVSTDSFVRF